MVRSPAPMRRAANSQVATAMVRSLVPLPMHQAVNSQVVTTMAHALR